ncbi:MAG: M23 family metallopeptidase [Bacteroidetes bacterium]|uniref:M23 family metallopeptidase n=1 Tax=Candidatus Cryptobacteroides faecipullorum TaxID=2840764 RepID=A0A9D9I8U3_9BACT|nr:M23 family metallopeptidase [Candidatus Cryptobacteroides faecipullorum]
MSSHYVYDKDDFKFRRQRRSLRSTLLRVLKYFLASVSLAVLYYIIFALVFSTDKERRLRSENRMYEKLYPEMEQERRLLEDVVAGLEAKDNMIYNDLFQTDVLTFGSQTSEYLSESDSMEVEDIVRHSEQVYEALDEKAGEIDNEFMRIFRVLASGNVQLPPLALPIRDFSYTSVGASVGDKINPFYKVKVSHDGLDMIAPSGTPVLASADGTVTSVQRSSKGLGNTVTVAHDGGYVTKYAHLSNIKVIRGRKIKKGTVIGSVGMSGKSFAPHLHYEIWKDTVALDPVSYFFSSVTPDEYSAMLLLSASAGQSMD